MRPGETKNWWLPVTYFTVNFLDNAAGTINFGYLDSSNIPAPSLIYQQAGQIGKSGSSTRSRGYRSSAILLVLSLAISILWTVHWHQHRYQLSNWRHRRCVLCSSFQLRLYGWNMVLPTWEPCHNAESTFGRLGGSRGSITRAIYVLVYDLGGWIVPCRGLVVALRL
jgi:hypothetical protein